MIQSNATLSIGVGLDTARYGHHVTFLGQDLQFAAKPFGFCESREGYDQLREAFHQLAQRHDNVHFHIRIDAAGQYSTSIASADTDNTTPEPSSRLRAVWTARPSFQNKSGNPATNRRRPKRTDFMEFASRENHDSFVVTVT